MSDTHFVVERVNWRRGRGGAFVRHPGAVRVAAFDTFADASAFRWAEEARARAAVNPFAGVLGCPAEQSHLPEPLLHDWLLDHGVEPPPPKAGRRDWAKWWAKAAPKWTDAQRTAAWEALDKVRFFRVVERPRRPVVYAVVEVVWGYNDEWYYPGPEGGATRTVYRSRASATAECDRLNAEARANWSVGDGLNLEGRRPAGADPFDPSAPPPADDDFCELADAPFYEVVELEWEGPA